MPLTASANTNAAVPTIGGKADMIPGAPPLEPAVLH